MTDTSGMSGNFSSPSRDVSLTRGMDPGAVKLLDAYHELEAQYGVERGEAFHATRMELQAVSGLAYPTITKWRRVLIGRGLIKPMTEDTYAIMGRISSPANPVRDSNAGLRVPLGIEKLKKEMRKGKSRGKKSSPDQEGPTQTEKRLCVMDALKVLRIPSGATFTRLVLGQLTKLVNEGFKLEDALAVARFGRRKFDEGDRYQSNIDPMYLWAASKFPVMLAAARTEPFHRKEFSVIADPDTRKDWNEDYQRRMKEKGLI